LSITWEPFFLTRDILSPQGEDLEEYMKSKYGPAVASRLTSPQNPLYVAGSKVGITFNKDRRVIPTVHAHSLVEWMKTVTSLTQVNVFMEILFEKYFSQGWNVAMMDPLLACVQEAGLNKDEASRALEDPQFSQLVMAKDRANKARGIHGVPFFIMGKKSFSGGQPIGVMEEMLEELLEKHDQ
jgi:predicted DsbA family dithiol-disulfide isomerase